MLNCVGRSKRHSGRQVSSQVRFDGETDFLYRRVDAERLVSSQLFLQLVVSISNLSILLSIWLILLNNRKIVISDTSSEVSPIRVKALSFDKKGSCPEGSTILVSRKSLSAMLGSSRRMIVALTLGYRVISQLTFTRWNTRINSVIVPGSNSIE